MSPLIPATGSRMAKRLSDIDLKITRFPGQGKSQSRYSHPAPVLKSTTRSSGRIAPASRKRHGGRYRRPTLRGEIHTLPAGHRSCALGELFVGHRNRACRQCP